MLFKGMIVTYISIKMNSIYNIMKVNISSECLLIDIRHVYDYYNNAYLIIIRS